MRRRLILQEIGSTRLRFFTSYFIDANTFYLFMNWFSTRVSNDRKYVCSCRLYVCINTRKFKTHLHTIGVHNTQPSQFCLLRFFFFWPLSGVRLFQSNHCFQAIEFVDWHVSEKLWIQSFLSFSFSLNMHAFHHTTILSRSFGKEGLAQWPPFMSSTKQKMRADYKTCWLHKRD